jgi:hypothetical protein
MEPHQVPRPGLDEDLFSKKRTSAEAGLPEQPDVPDSSPPSEEDPYGWRPRKKTTIDHDKLHAVVSYSNFGHASRRRQLHDEFIQYIKSFEPEIEVWVVEVALHNNPFEVTRHDDIHHLQLRSKETELWYKEHSINLLVQGVLSRHRPTWKYVMVIDADIRFVNRPDWPLEIKKQLTHYEVVQCWKTATDMGPNNTPLSGRTPQTSFMSRFIDEGGFDTQRFNRYGKQWHPGFCWAYTRSGWDKIGGMFQYAVLGAGDHHMACCFIGRGEVSIPRGVSRGYRNAVMQYNRRCIDNLRENVGYADLWIVHFFHGDFANRKYNQRWQIIIEYGFDPFSHLRQDAQGLFIIESSMNPGFQRDIQNYIRQRNEDANVAINQTTSMQFMVGVQQPGAASRR